MTHASVISYEDGKIVQEAWYINGVTGRVGGPAMTYTNRRGEIVQEWHIDGQLHRTDAPAIITSNDKGPISVEWYVNGRQIPRPTSGNQADEYKRLINRVKNDNSASDFAHAMGDIDLTESSDYTDDTDDDDYYDYV